MTALEQAPDGIIVLQMRRRGFMMELIFDEALALGEVMGKVAEHMIPQRQR